jgi:uncharacterized protein (TIGR00369 family)
MTDSDHHRKLERMYNAAPISRWQGATIEIGDGRSEVRIPVRPELYHSGNAVHGSMYFRALDDAAFFAVNSRVREVFVLTVSFTIHLTRPITSGELRATGRLLHASGRLFLAESTLVDAQGQMLGHGSGVFSRSSIALEPAIGYA